ncbi:hypothetical protein ACJ2A9_00765 [Anaerobacillus sp. MEB173]|uniref:hypothetical protein n=1 Tax=Anaerobacillus sp. MEB173 TaxID=3383345 RepID=UPI003F92B426
MTLPLFITIAFLIAYLTFFMKKKMTFLHNAILYMVMAIVTKNYMTIMYMELRVIKHTEDPMLALSLLIMREMILPLLVVMYINLRIPDTSWQREILLFATIVGLLQIMTGLSSYLGIVEFIKWNMYYALLVNISYVLIGLGINKSLLAISILERETT